MSEHQSLTEKIKGRLGSATPEAVSKVFKDYMGDAKVELPDAESVTEFAGLLAAVGVPRGQARMIASEFATFMPAAPQAQPQAQQPQVVSQPTQQPITVVLSDTDVTKMLPDALLAQGGLSHMQELARRGLQVVLNAESNDVDKPATLKLWLGEIKASNGQVAGRLVVSPLHMMQQPTLHCPATDQPMLDGVGPGGVKWGTDLNELCVVAYYCTSLPKSKHESPESYALDVAARYRSVKDEVTRNYRTACAANDSLEASLKAKLLRRPSPQVLL